MKTINELQVCLLLSFIAHAGMIGTDAFDFRPAKEKKPFDVEFRIEEEILPGRYEVKEKKKIEKLVAERKEVAKPVAKEIEKEMLVLEKEKNVALTAEESSAETTLKSEKIDKELKKSLLTYQDSIKQKIQQEKNYPRWALRAGHEGEARIAFSVLSSGRMKNVKLVSSSGFGELDNEALNAVNRAAPFLPFPETFQEDEIRVELDIIFYITKKSLNE